MNEEYEKIEFKTWQDLAKFVIDGGEVYGKYRDGSYRPILFNGIEFTEHVEVFFKYCYTKKQQTIEGLIKIKPRLCRVWDDIIECNGPRIDIINSVTNENYKFRGKSCGWKNAEMLTDEEIKEFLNDK